MNLLSVPRAGVSKGWRKAVADRVAPRLAARTPLHEEHARAALGAVFLGLSTYYVVGSIRRFNNAEVQRRAEPTRGGGAVTVIDPRRP